MVALQILVLPVQVRILVGQQLKMQKGNPPEIHTFQAGFLYADPFNGTFRSGLLPHNWFGIMIPVPSPVYTIYLPCALFWEALWQTAHPAQLH